MKNLLLLITLLLFLNACDTTSSSDEEEANLYNGFAFNIDEDREFSIIGAHESDAMIAVKPSADQSRPDAIVYKHSLDEPEMYLQLDENGLPDKLFFEDIIILYDNFTESSVDIAVIDGDGNIEVFRELETDNSFFFSQNTLANVLNKENGNFDPASLIRWGGHALGVATCVGSLAAAGYSLGALSPLAAIGCGSTAINILLEFAPGDNALIRGTSLAVGTFGGVTGCITNSIDDCWMAIGSVVLELSGAYLTYTDENSEEILLGEGTLTSGFGDVQITLTWNTTADLDLWVTDPFDERIWYQNRNSSSGGQLDRDDLDGYGPENIFWPEGEAPEGQYKVEVDHFSGASPTDYNVRIEAFGSVQSYAGTIQSGQTVLIATFESGDDLPASAVLKVSTNPNANDYAKKSESGGVR